MSSYLVLIFLGFILLLIIFGNDLLHVDGEKTLAQKMGVYEEEEQPDWNNDEIATKTFMVFLTSVMCQGDNILQGKKDAKVILDKFYKEWKNSAKIKIYSTCYYYEPSGWRYDAAMCLKVTYKINKEKEK